MLIDKNFMDQYRLSPNDLQLTMSQYTPLNIEANHFFLKEGEVSKQLGFVKSGLFRSYTYDDNANEITQQFFPEGTLIISYDSFNNQVPSKENIKAIADSEVMVITYENQNKLYESIPAWKQICKDCSDQQNHEMIQRLREFQTLSATERYRKFCEENPSILQRATLGHIASYIGVDIATLSRIRKKK